MDMKKVYENLTKGIKHHFRKYGIKKAVIGLSGGIDSALALRLTADAIGKDNVTALLMPEKGLTKLSNVSHAIGLCESIKVDYRVIPINSFLNQFGKIKGWKQNKNAEINTKARIRAVILYNYANSNDAIVIGTSNKTELKLGYFTKYGDGACDIEVIGDLYKKEVRGLARYLNLPLEIINKAPSAELYKNHTDEGEIGETYENIDNMLKGKKKMSEKIRKLIQRNKHKTDKIFVVKK